MEMIIPVLADCPGAGWIVGDPAWGASERGSGVRIVALGAALAGGACLVANLFVDHDALAVAGLVVLAVAVAVVGARLVRAPWLAVVCAAGAVALAWAVLEVLREAVPDLELEAVVGGVATLCVAVATMRPHPAPQRPGNHRS